MDYESVLDYLRKVELRGTNLGLDNTAEIIRHFPFDPGRIIFIQVAGTNGKGSTAYFLTSILHAAGWTTGLFTSPHLHDIRERITVDKSPVSKTGFVHAVEAVKGISENLLQKRIISHMPTFFEYTFLAALYHFAAQNVTAAVLEVGLGGRLDATSTITPRVSVITGISHDHTGILGKRIKEIAFEKAGIIKEDVPVVCGCGTRSIANSVIKKRSRQLNAPFYNVFDSKNRLEIEEFENGCHCRFITNGESFAFDVHLNGRHQPRNAAAAVKTVRVLNAGLPTGSRIPDAAIREGIETTRIPCRIETMEIKTNGRPPLPVILDGGHNVESIHALKDFLEQKKKHRLTLIFGVLEDKNYKQMARLLLPFAKNVILTEPLSMRALPAEKLVPLFGKNGQPKVVVRKDLENAIDTAAEFKEEILVTGSFYLVGAARHIITDGKYGIQSIHGD